MQIAGEVEIKILKSDKKNYLKRPYEAFLQKKGKIWLHLVRVKLWDEVGSEHSVGSPPLPEKPDRIIIFRNRINSNLSLHPRSFSRSRTRSW